MKKITLILTVFILIISAQSYAQEVSPQLQVVDQVEYDDVKKDKHKAKKGKKKRAHKHAKHKKRASKRHVKAMRKVAKADGKVTPGEKEVIRSEKRKMKRKGKRNGKRKAIQRRKNIERTSEIPRGRN